MSSAGGNDAFHVVPAGASNLGTNAVLAVDVAAVLDGVIVTVEGRGREA